MHEYSIVQALLDGCEENVIKNKARKVVEVIIKIGVTSGVEPELLKTAFDTFKLKTVCNDALLTINMQDIKVRCEDCAYEQEIQKYMYACPKCKGHNLKIIDGEDMYLMQLVME